MNTFGMEYNYQERDPSRRYKGMAVVVVAHALLAWVLIAGMGVTVLPTPKRPPVIVQIEQLLPPEPPKPPVKQPPKSEAPPVPQDTFVPVPDVAPTEPSSVTIESAPAPAAEPVLAQTSNTQTDMRVACPTQVAPQMPRKALQDGTIGVVRALAVIQNGRVRSVTILSGPRIFHDAVRAAMLQYRCSNDGAADMTATQDFNFRLE